MSDPRPIPGVPGAVLRWTEDVPYSLIGGVPYSRSGQVAGNTLLICPEGVGRCLIARPDAVDFSVDPKANPSAVERFLRGFMLVSLLHLRGELPIHASAVASPDGSGALVLCGDSGSGKSTTTATLIQQRWRFLSDDVVRLTQNGTTMLAWAGRGSIRLLPDALERLTGLPVFMGDEAEEEDGKVQVPQEVAELPAPVLAIVCLGGQEPLPRLERLAGAEALVTLVKQIPGRRVVQALGRQRQQGAAIQHLLSSCPVFRLHGRKTASAEALGRFLTERLSAPITKTSPAGKEV